MLTIAEHAVHHVAHQLGARIRHNPDKMPDFRITAKHRSASRIQTAGKCMPLAVRKHH